jgi:methylisocitrate lyase
LFTKEEFGSVGISLVLYPLSASRSMFKAALTTYDAIIKTGTQQSVIETMQTREELYQQLGYYAYEQKLDKYNGRSK